jgi:MFS family permease
VATALVRRTGSASVLVLLCAAQLLVVTNITLVTITIPAVRRDLGFSDGGVQWIVSAYAVVFGGCLMICGRVGDLVGRRRVLVGGLVLFAAGSAGCGTAAAPWVLVLARGVQGVGAAAVTAAALMVLLATFPSGHTRGRALGYWSAAQAMGGASGWLAGGAISQVASWRWVFLGNVPFALGCAATVLWLVPAHGASSPRRKADALGGVLVTVAVLSLVFGAGDLGGAGLVALAVALAVFAVFRFVEQRAPNPIVPPGTFRDGPLCRATLTLAAIYAMTTPVLTLCALYLSQVMHLGGARSGLLFVPFNLAVIAGSLLASRALTRVGAAVALPVAVALIGAGAAILATLPAKGDCTAVVVTGFVVLGVGGGSASVASNAEGTAAVGAERTSVASGLLNTAPELGTALGTALFVTVAHDLTAAQPVPATADALVFGYRVTFWAIAIFAAVVAVSLTRAARPTSGQRSR